MIFYFKILINIVFKQITQIAPCVLHKQKIRREHINKYSAVHQNLPFRRNAI